MSEPSPIQIATFIGTSELAMTDAIERARREMDAWYKLQRLTHLGDGGSLFQFSTAAYLDGIQHVFMITVFDTRYRRD